MPGHPARPAKFSIDPGPRIGSPIGTLEQRLCRWLLLSLDRMPGRDLRMTHELIAVALGVKREGVTEAAGRLRQRGAIEYRRGHIRVLDRPVLEQAACECYQ